jgi:hypothetical protein
LVYTLNRIIFADVQNTDRYVIRPTDAPDRWCVWDTQRDVVVFGAKDLAEPQASDIAQRLNEAYRRSQQQ